MDGILRQMLGRERVAGAYLIEGSIGFVETEAEEFIGALFCHRHTACGQCSPCFRIQSGSHPDILRISTGRKTIQVEDVDSLPAWAALKPFEGAWKAVVIARADTMTETAQNKLLKVIEEPPANTVFLLGAVNGKNLLPTVLSRCIIIRMRKKGDDDLAPLLKERFSVSDATAAVLAKTAGFDPYAAFELYARNYTETRDLCIRAVRRLLESKSRAASVTLDILMQCADRMDDMFLALTLYIRDIVYYGKTADATLLYNSDRIVEIKEHARMPAQKLVRILSHLQAAQKKSRQCAGIQKKLLLESMLFEILEVVLK